MLANSNLSLISPKSAASVSSAGSEPTATGESFDSVFQQANASLSDGDSVAVAENSANPNLTLVESDKVATDAAPINSGGLESDLAEVADSSKTEALSLDTAKGGVATTGVLSALSTADGADAETSTIDPQPLLNNKALPIEGEVTDAVIAGAAATGAVAMNNKSASTNGTELLNSNMTGELETSAVSGKVLQSEGGDVASLQVSSATNSSSALSGASADASQDQLNSNGLMQKNSTASNQVISDGLPSQGEAAALLGAGTVAADKVASDKSASVNVSKVASDNVSKAASDKSASVSASKVNPSNLTSVASGEVGVVEGVNPELIVTGKAAQVGGANGDKSVDVAAGLAMIGAGAASKQAKSTSNQGVLPTKTTMPVEPVVDGELAANSDLDWIVQQMNGEGGETLTSLDSQKSNVQALTNTSTTVSNSDPLKQVAPLSMGLAVLESDALSSNAQSGALLDSNESGKESIKPDLDNLKSLESGTPIRAGLGDSSTTSSMTSSAGQGQITDAKLGLVVGANNNQPNMTMQVPPTHPNWSSEMGDKMMWMNRQGIQQAEIHLDPPELGSLTVKVSVDSDVATVSFVAASTQVKDLLEGQVQRLREMMAQQGVELAEVDVNVSQQGKGSNQSEAGADSQGAFAGNQNETDDVDADLMPKEAFVSKSKVDFYA